MTRKAFNIILVVITVTSLIAALILTSMSIEISKNKAMNKAKEEVLGTWTDTANPQMIIQFTSENEYKVMGQVQAQYQVDPTNRIITLSFLPEFDSRREYYQYELSPNHSQLTLTNVDTSQVSVYTR